MDQPDRSTSTAIWLCNSNHSSPTALVPGWYMISLKTTTLSAWAANAPARRRKRSVASRPTPPWTQRAGELEGTGKHGGRGTSIIGMFRHHHAGEAAGRSRECPADRSSAAWVIALPLRNLKSGCLARRRILIITQPRNSGAGLLVTVP